MKKKCIVVRALPLDRDSRTLRYKKFLDKDYSVEFNTWEDNTKLSRRGLEKLKLSRKNHSLLLAYPLYITYLFLFALFKIKKNDIVIAMDLDTYLPIKMVYFIKKFDIILDIVDPISQTRYRKVPLNKIFDYLEYRIISSKKSKVILPSSHRVLYYVERLKLKNNNFACNTKICENVADVNFNSTKTNFNIPVSRNITIGYFGSLDENRGLNQLVSYVLEQTDFQIVIAGRGVLSDRFSDLQHERFVFLGEFTSSDLPFLYNAVDFVWAYYDPSVLLHHYAAPNKFYEHLAFKTPIIFNHCVPQSEYILNKLTGLVINDALTDSSFSELVNNIRKFDFESASYSDWGSKYENYSFSID